MKKLLRFLFSLILVFLIGFFLAGGTNAIRPGTLDRIHELTQPAPSAQRETPREVSPSGAGESQDPNLWDRTKRFLFLQQAIERRLPRAGYVKLADVPDDFTNAIIAVEDNRFYTHHGFDVEGIMRATLVNLQHGEIEEGASTITQQLVKNLFLSHERSFGRKAEELVLALDVEARCSKDEILELYLNTIYFGSGYYGLYDASIGYFGKKPSELALPEAAMLAGLPNAPSLYSPYEDFLMAKKRQFIVLDAMVRNGSITKAIAEDAKIAPIYLAH